jgi:hypothetical protein
MSNGRSKRNGRHKAKGKQLAITYPAKQANHQQPLGSKQTVARMGNPSPTFLSGTDYLGRVTVKAKANRVQPKDDILLRMPISASSFPGTRLTQLSQLWERYRWSHCAISFVNAVPKTVACQLVAYIDTDPSDDPEEFPDVLSLIRQGFAQAGSRAWNIDRDMTIPLVIRGDDQLYYTGEDKQNARFSQQGVLYILQNSDAINFNAEGIPEDLECGNLFLNWGVHFSMPQINPAAVTPPEPVPFVPILYKEGDYGFGTSGGTVINATGLVPGKEYIVTVSSHRAGVSETFAPSVDPQEQPINFFATSDGQPSIQVAETNMEYSTNTTDYIVSSSFTGIANSILKADDNGTITFSRNNNDGDFDAIGLYTWKSPDE